MSLLSSRTVNDDVHLEPLVVISAVMWSMSLSAEVEKGNQEPRNEKIQIIAFEPLDPAVPEISTTLLDFQVT